MWKGSVSDSSEVDVVGRAAVAAGAHPAAGALQHRLGRLVVLLLLQRGGRRRGDRGDDLGRSRRQCVVRHGQRPRGRFGHSGDGGDGSAVGGADATRLHEALLGDRQAIAVDVQRKAAQAVQASEEAPVRFTLKVSNWREKKKINCVISVGRSGRNEKIMVMKSGGREK